MKVICVRGNKGETTVKGRKIESHEVVVEGEIYIVVETVKGIMCDYSYILMGKPESLRYRADRFIPLSNRDERVIASCRRTVTITEVERYRVIL